MRSVPSSTWRIASARSAIAARALMLARRAAPVADDRVFVIGDTPHDIECGQAIGARTIAVATGGYTLDELHPYDPWRSFETLPPVGWITMDGNLYRVGDSIAQLWTLHGSKRLPIARNELFQDVLWEVLCCSLKKTQMGRQLFMLN